MPIASSGMGALREGADQRLDRKSVIKLIRPGKRRDADAMRRFNREARITARLGDPGTPCALCSPRGWVSRIAAAALTGASGT